MRTRLGASVAIVSFTIASCTNMPGTDGSKESGGQVLGGATGGVLGAVIGSQVSDNPIVAIGAGVAGVLLGGLLGGSIGAHLDQQDRQRMAEATLAAVEQDDEVSRVAWENPETQVRGEVEAGEVRYVERKVIVQETPQLTLLKNRTLRRAIPMSVRNLQQRPTW